MQMGKKGPRWAQKHQTPANFDKTLPPVTEESGSESSFDDEHPGAWARQNPQWRDIYGCESPRTPPGDWGAQEDAERAARCEVVASKVNHRSCGCSSSARNCEAPTVHVKKSKKPGRPERLCVGGCGRGMSAKHDVCRSCARRWVRERAKLEEECRRVGRRIGSSVDGCVRCGHLWVAACAPVTGCSLCEVSKHIVKTLSDGNSWKQWTRAQAEKILWTTLGDLRKLLHYPPMPRPVTLHG